MEKTIAITRQVGKELETCELSFVDREPLEITKALQQHGAYEECLRELGVDVISLPAEARCPDGVFVEDAAVVVDELAVICRSGAESRRGETESIAAALKSFRKVAYMRADATIDGGDVLKIGKRFYVGISTRTNAAGCQELERLLDPFGYSITPVPVTGCLHLKTACTYLGENTLLANPIWADLSGLRNFELIAVDGEEPFAANSLKIGNTILYPSCFSKTQQKLEEHGFNIKTLNISQLQKAEAGLTCLSIIFQG